MNIQPMSNSCSHNIIITPGNTILPGNTRN